MTQVPMPKEFEIALLKHLKKYYLSGPTSESAWNKKDTSYFARGIVRLNEAFTTSRMDSSGNYFKDPLMRSGYLAYFLPVNAMKAASVFGKIMPLLPKKRVKLLDIGSGPLSLVFGYLFYLQSINKTHKLPSEIEVHAVEQNDKILKEGMALLQTYLEASGLAKKLKVKIVPIVDNALKFRSKEKDFDLICLGNFLNEIPERQNQSEYILQTLERFAHAKTVFFMLEPAFKKISRDVQSLRDEILEQTAFRVVAPCLHQLTCPLNLTSKGDWCHFMQAWQTPQFIKEFDHITGLKKTFLLYSYLILQNHGEFTHPMSEFVSISNIMREQGRFELIGCGPGGRIRFVRSHKHKDPVNDDFEKIDRGQYFSFPNFDGQKFELNKISNIGKHDKIILK